VGIALLLAIGCRGGGGAAAPKRAPGCQLVAQTMARLVDGASAAERETTLRLAVEVVDLCQTPGLSPAARTCVASATSATAVRACPALPLVPAHAGVVAGAEEPVIGASTGEAPDDSDDDSDATP